MRAAIPIAAMACALALGGVASAQRGRQTQRLTVDFEVAEVVEAPRGSCGRAAVYATVRGQVLDVRNGEYEPSDIYVRWLSCGMSRARLEVELIGHRFRARVRRWIRPRERRLPLERQPPFYVVGRADAID